MDRFLRITLFLLLALTLSQAYGIEVTDETIGETPARAISYRSSEDDLDEAIGTYIDVLNTEERWGAPVLPQQLGPNVPPRRWITLDVEGRTPEDKARLITRDDNMYIVGFANQTGHIFSFEGYEGSLAAADATALTVGANYFDFLPGPANGRLQRVPLSKELYDDSVHTLRMFPYVSTEAFELAVPTMIIVHCEAARFKKIRSKVTELWESGGVGYLDEKEEKYCLNWALMSLKLFCADQGIELTGRDQTALDDAGIETVEDVKDNLAIIIRPLRFDPNNPEKSCKPLDPKKKRIG